MTTTTPTMDFKLEVVTLPVADVDRAKRFYASLGWREDADFPIRDDFRVVQMTPPGSSAAVIFGTGVTDAEPGSAEALVLTVRDVEAARADLLARGIAVSEVFHGASGFDHASVGTGARLTGPDPDRASYKSWAAFSDSEGNGWLLQEVTSRLPGRRETDIAALAGLLHDTAEHHDPYEKSAPPHDWWDWYAAYLDARLDGGTEEEAAATAGRYMEDTGRVAAR